VDTVQDILREVLTILTMLVTPWIVAQPDLDSRHGERAAGHTQQPPRLHRLGLASHTHERMHALGEGKCVGVLPQECPNPEARSAESLSR
jgi:hypothetical protein